jgi:hypothetical protein
VPTPSVSNSRSGRKLRCLVPLLSALALLVCACAENPDDAADALPDRCQLVFTTPALQQVWDGGDQLLAEIRDVSPELTEELLLYMEEVKSLLTHRLDPAELTTLQDIHDTGLDVTRTSALGLKLGLSLRGPTASFLLSLPLHDPLRFQGFIDELLGEDRREAEELGERHGVQLRRSSSGLFAAHHQGVLLLGDDLELVTAGLDALLAGEGRFFNDADHRRLQLAQADAHLGAYLDVKRFRALLEPLAQGFGLPETAVEQLLLTRGVSLGLRIQPRGLRLRLCSVHDGRLDIAAGSAPAVSGDALFYADLPLQGSHLGSLLGWAGERLTHGATREQLAGLEEFGNSLIDGLRFNVYDGGGFPTGYFAVKLADPAGAREFYEAAVLPLLRLKLSEYLTEFRILRTETADGLVDIFDIAALAQLHLQPAVAFIGDHFVFTAMRERLPQIRRLLRSGNTTGNLPADYRLAGEKLTTERVLSFCSIDKTARLVDATPLLRIPAAARELAKVYELLAVGMDNGGELTEVEVVLCKRDHQPAASLMTSEVVTPWPWWLWLSIGGVLVLTGLFFAIRALVRRRRRKKQRN